MPSEMADDEEIVWIREEAASPPDTPAAPIPVAVFGDSPQSVANGHIPGKRQFEAPSILQEPCPRVTGRTPARRL